MGSRLWKGPDVDQYARRLDFFKIELGVVRPGGKIDYAFHLSKPKPDTRTITEAYKNERRYWLRWTDGELKKADDELLERAGIDPQGWLLKFVPPDTEVLLANLEQAKAGPDRECAGEAHSLRRPRGWTGSSSRWSKRQGVRTMDPGAHPSLLHSTV